MPRQVITEAAALRRVGALSRLPILGVLATLLAFGVNAQSGDRPRPVCSGAIVDNPAGLIAACTAFIAENPQRTPTLARAYIWRGRAYADTGEPDRAIDDLNQAIDIDPSTTALNVRAAAYRMKGDTERALADYERSLSLKRDALTLLGISQIQWVRERYDLALLAMDEAMMHWPADASFYHIRGNIYRDSGQFAKAIQDYDKALELVSWLEDIRSERCVALSLMGRSEDGLRDCNRAVEKNPANPVNFLNRGAVYLHLSRAGDAMADFNRILEGAPGDPEALYGRSIARRLMGDVVGGNADIASAQAANPSVARRLEKIGVKP
jgi:tetratricopeptide (TPR) repeat protein